ncbi:MAG: 30S ribosomal protein S4e [Candidatus Aenigmarchaeota archaeon]|nr:30S ribosomal protein S4e [Candidatus Aenigmarchaeota archaeon]
MKRHAAPVYWPIARKKQKFVVRPSPGPHGKNAMPLAVILRDALGYAENMKDAKSILNNGIVKVNGVVRKTENFPVGLMDILSLSDNEHYRMMPAKNGMGLKKITDKNVRLAKVMRKTINRGSKIQLSLHDGTSIITKDSNIKTGDVLVFDSQDSSVKNVLKMKKGALVVVIRGRNRGKTGLLEKIIITRSSQPNRAIIKVGKDEMEMPNDFLFVIGEDKPLIEMGDNNE